MGLGRDRTRDPWNCSQTRICSQTRYRLRYAARCDFADVNHSRIEIHILSLHWMMKNNSYLNVCEARSASRKH